MCLTTYTCHYTFFSFVRKVFHKGDVPFVVTSPQAEHNPQMELNLRQISLTSRHTVS